VGLSESTSGVAFEKNSSNNHVANSHFINIASPNEGRIHAFYISTHSSHNVIERNRFYSVNGTPIKARNSSNYNRISANRFDRTGDEDKNGISGFFSDGFDTRDECPSWFNEFTYNELYTNYDGRTPRYTCFPPDKLTYEIMGRCGWPPTWWPRVICTPNVQH
jgi:hypothetical protein